MESVLCEGRPGMADHKQNVMRSVGQSSPAGLRTCDVCKINRGNY